MELKSPRRNSFRIGCGCDFAPAAALPPGSNVFGSVGSKLRITGIKVFGATLDAKIAQADRPYGLVKLETNQGVVGWGEATLEGKASAAMACVNDLHDFLVGSDPMQSEHLYQLMYIGSFYRGGPVLGSAISGIDQAIWDIRGKVLGMPVYQLLGGPLDARGVRGYYHAQAWTLQEAKELGDQTRKAGVTALKFQLPTYMEWIETNAKLTRAVQSMETIREGLGPDIDFAGREREQFRRFRFGARTQCCGLVDTNLFPEHSGPISLRLLAVLHGADRARLDQSGVEQNSRSRHGEST